MDKSKEFQTGNILTISFAHFFHDIFTSFLAPVLPLLIDKLSLSYTMAGLLSVFQRVPSLLNPLIGLYADRINMRYLVVLAPLITALFMSTLGMISNYSFLTVALMIVGLSSAVFHVPSPVLIKQAAGRQTGKGMSIFMLGGESARFIGPIIILSAVSLWGLEGTWRLAIFGILISIILFFAVRRLNWHHDKHIVKNKTGTKKILKELFPFFMILSGIIFFRAMIKTALTLFLPTYLNAKGYSLWVGGVSLSIIQLSGAVGTLFAGSVSDRIGRIKTLLIITALTPVLSWFFITMNGDYAFVVLFFIGFFLFASGPVILALVQDVGADHPAFVNGVFMTLNFSLSSLAVMIVGGLIDIFNFGITYKIAIGLSLIALPLVFVLNAIVKQNSQA